MYFQSCLLAVYSPGLLMLETTLLLNNRILPASLIALFLWQMSQIWVGLGLDKSVLLLAERPDEMLFTGGVGNVAKVAVDLW